MKIKYYLEFSIVTLLLCFFIYIPITHAELDSSPQTNVGIHFTKSEDGLNNIPAGPSDILPSITKPSDSFPQTGERKKYMSTMFGYILIILSLLSVRIYKKVDNKEELV